ncbi:MAG: glycosyltransferase family 9 protein [Phycisphaerae bacterium]|jgi:heptosyltransferase-2
MARTKVMVNSDPESILVVLPTWVGDFVMATPTLRAIRGRFAESRIVFLIEPNLRDLVRGGDWMDECVEWPAKEFRTPLRRPYRDLVWALRKERFDWAILLPNSFRSALIARLGGAVRRFGYDRDGRGFLLTDRLPVKNLRGEQGVASHSDAEGRDSRVSAQAEACESGVSVKDEDQGGVNSAQAEACGSGDVGARLEIPAPPGPYLPMRLVEYYADLAEFVGCERPSDRFELLRTPDCDKSVQQRLDGLGVADPHPLVVLSPGAKYGAAKCWAPERFAEVADRLIESENAVVAITCGPGEEPIAHAIASNMKREGIIFDAPLPTLGELKSLIARSHLLICNDAGPRHIAKAFGVPVVTVFGPTHPEWTATEYEAERIVRIDVDCGPCQERVCPLGHLKCMTGVTTDMVHAKAKELLDVRLTGSFERVSET